MEVCVIHYFKRLKIRATHLFVKFQEITALIMVAPIYRTRVGSEVSLDHFLFIL